MASLGSTKQARHSTLFDNGRLSAPQPRNPNEQLGPKSWWSRVAGRLRKLAVRLEFFDIARGRLRAKRGISTNKMRGYSQDNLKSKTAEAQYSATDPVWHDVGGDGCLVPLREHVRRLCTTCLEIAPEALAGDWDAVAYNLRLAYSLSDLSADTDLDGAGIWCSPAADYDAVDGEVTAKHLAATIVFTFVWSAYERAIATMCPSKIGRGATGRDFIVGLTSCHMPYLRDTLFGALALDEGGTSFRHPDMRRLMNAGSAPGVAAEHLRQFRNRLIHGDLQRPEPKDWGWGSKYVPNQDYNLRRFHANIRLLLLLIQILAGEDLPEGLELSYMLEEAYDAKLILMFLHCNNTTVSDTPELDFGLQGWPLPNWH